MYVPYIKLILVVNLKCYNFCEQFSSRQVLHVNASGYLLQSSSIRVHIWLVKVTSNYGH